MVFENARSAISWYATKILHGYSVVGAISISETSGVDISNSFDGYDHADTFCDIEKIICSTLSKTEINALIYNAIYGIHDTQIYDGTIIPGSFEKFSNILFKKYRKNKKEPITKPKRVAYFKSYINSAEKAIEEKLIEEGYILSN